MPAPNADGVSRADAVLHALAAVRTSFAAAHPDGDASLIERAIQTASDAHRGQRRRNGDPFFLHPLTVGAIVAETGADAETVCAAILHDVVEDTPYTLARLRTEFGPRIMSLVRDQADTDLLTRVAAEVTTGDLFTPEAADVLLVKIADRLHNMRTVAPLDHARQLRKSHEVLDLFVPIAQHLGHDSLGHELRALAHATLSRIATTPGPRTVPVRVINLATILLPRQERDRWFEEWTAELAVLPSRRDRIRFAWQVLRGSPALTRALRRSTAAAPTQGPTTITSLTALLTAGTALAAVLSPTGPPSWILLTAVLGGLGLLTATLFIRTDEPVKRLIEIIRAWRNT